MNFALNLAANKLPGISITWGMQDALTTTQSYRSRRLAQCKRRLPLQCAAIPAPDAEEARLEALLVAGV